MQYRTWLYWLGTNPHRPSKSCNKRPLRSRTAVVYEWWLRSSDWVPAPTLPLLGSWLRPLILLSDCTVCWLLQMQINTGPAVLLGHSSLSELFVLFPDFIQQRRSADLFCPGFSKFRFSVYRKFRHFLPLLTFPFHLSALIWWNCSSAGQWSSKTYQTSALYAEPGQKTQTLHNVIVFKLITESIHTHQLLHLEAFWQDSGVCLWEFGSNKQVGLAVWWFSSSQWLTLYVGTGKALP